MTALALVSAPLACGDDGGALPDDTNAPGDATSPPDGDATSPPDGDAADAADTTTLPPSPISVRRTTTEEDLVTGPVPFGRIGRSFVLDNGLVRFLIQDAGASAVYQLYGGSVVGADNTRAPGLPGQSVLRELFPVVDFRVQAPDKVSIVADGSDGERGILRLEGPLASSKIIAILDAVAGTADLHVIIEYELDRGARDLLIRTIIDNPTDEAVSVLVGDFMVASDLLQMFSPGPGFDTRGTLGDTRWLALRGDEVSYGYVYGDKGVFNAPFVESSGTFAILETGLDIPAHERRSVERRLLVGDGSLSDVVDRLEAAVGTPTGPVSGVVSDPGGAPVAGVWVSALPITGAGAQGGASTNQARTDASGAFAMQLPPGEYDLVASGTERVPSAPARVTLATGGEVVGVALTLSPPASVTVKVTTDMPAPTGGGSAPVKVALKALDDDANDTRLGDFPRVGGWRIEFVGPGYDTLTIAPGRYRVVLSRGPELTPITLDDVTLEDGGELSAHLARAIDTPGWLACDFHQHTIGSLDARTPFDVRVREDLAEGLECFATSEHDHVIDLRPWIQALGAAGIIYNIVADEISVNGVGHFNAYPMPLDPADPLAYSGVQLFAGLTIQQLFDKLHQLPGDRVVQVNHPRGSNGKGFFASIAFDPRLAVGQLATLPTGFEALEVNGDLGDASQFTREGWAGFKALHRERVPVLADWFGLLNQGLPVCGVANSDCHDPGDGCGWPRTYLALGDDVGALTDAAIVAAVRAQHAIGSRGLTMAIDVDDAFRMGKGDLVDGREGAELHVVVSAIPGASVTQVELYENGLLIDTAPAAAPGEGSAVWADARFQLSPTRDSWYVVVARGPGGMAPIFDGGVFAFANPVYVDADGDGVFEAPGPVAAP